MMSRDRTLSDLIEDGIKKIVFRHCSTIGLTKEEADHIFESAVNYRQPILRMADHWVVEGVESIAVIIPETVLNISGRFDRLVDNSDDSIIECAQQAIVVMYFAAFRRRREPVQNWLDGISLN